MVCPVPAVPDALLDSLNDAQREAVLHREGPLLVLAGAGSGKTRVIVHRVAHLVRDEGVMPWHILCVTFTNKAAGEMRERLRSLLGDLAEELWVSTFHAFGARFLRREAAAAGLPASFPIYDTDDQLRLVKQVMAELRLADGEPVTARDVLHHLDRWKNDALRPDEVKVGELDVERQASRTVYARYQQALRRAGAVDFGDLLALPLQLLEADAALRARWSARFRHLLVDEFQDTNPAQYRLVRLLAGPKRNVCVVGDDDQAIYRWRGADVANILEFDRDWDGARVVKLEQNYRSTSAILEAAHAVIAKAHRRRGKHLWTEQQGGAPLHLLVGADEHEEAVQVARAIDGAHGQGARWEDIAILYRTNAQSRAFEQAVRERRIPYIVVRAMSFYERAEVKDAAAYLRLALTPRSDLDLLRIVNRPPRGVGDRSVERLVAHARDRGLALFDALREADAIEGLTPKVKKALAELRGLVADLHARAPDLDAGLAVQEVLSRSGMLDRLKAEGTDEAVERAENLVELLTAAREFDEAELGRTRRAAAPGAAARGGPAAAPGAAPAAAGAPPDGDPATAPLARFLESIALLGDADAPTPEGKVALMTLHAAKGLEFDAVFLGGLEEGVLPYTRPWRRPEAGEALLADEDEERRLCYVGMTRARKLLTLSLARRRMTYGEAGPTWRESQPSRFLGDLPPALFGLTGRAAAAPAPAAPRVRQHPGALPGEPVIELDDADGFAAAPAPEPRPPARAAPPLRRPAAARAPPPAPRGEPRVVYDDEQGALAAGDRVVHASLGEGIVRSTEGAGPDAKVTVAFYDRGEKRVIARFLRRA